MTNSFSTSFTWFKSSFVSILTWTIFDVWSLLSTSMSLSSTCFDWNSMIANSISRSARLSLNSTIASSIVCTITNSSKFTTSISNSRQKSDLRKSTKTYITSSHMSSTRRRQNEKSRKILRSRSRTWESEIHKSCLTTLEINTPSPETSSRPRESRYTSWEHSRSTRHLSELEINSNSRIDIVRT